MTEVEKLKEENRKLLEACAGATMLREDLRNAVLIIKKMLLFIDCVEHEDIYKEAEKFLEEVP